MTCISCTAADVSSDSIQDVTVNIKLHVLFILDVRLHKICSKELSIVSDT